MSITLNEHEWAEEMIEQRTLGKKPFETLTRIARYYLDKNYPKSAVRDMLESYILQCDPRASLPKYSKIIDTALNKALKYEAISIDYIGVTTAELRRIGDLEGIQTKRLAFTLLVLSKYWDMINPNSDHWVNNKDSEIMSLANINTSIKRQSAMYRTLKELGMIQFSKKIDNVNVRVCFAEDDDVELYITDMRNLGYQYLKYCGEPYFECENCGITVKEDNPVSGRKQKYCKSCAVEIKTKQSVDSVMRDRTNKNVGKNDMPLSPLV